MLSWGADWRRGFRLRNPADGPTAGGGHGVRFLELSFTVADLAAGRGALAFVKSSGDAFIIRTGGGGEPCKQKFVSRGIRAVRCGGDAEDDVTLLTDTGSVLRVDAAQTPYRLSPLPALSKVQVCQVACGRRHTVALTADGRVFTWGQDSRGQLGLGKSEPGAKLPKCLRSLSAVPVVGVAAGGEQSFALSVSGGVFGWGRNDRGQLGLGDAADRHSPTAVHALNMKKTIAISCGEEHTATLTKGGVVFTFGSGQHGQLGHNSTRDELRPRLVAELWGSKVAQVACGRHHTFVLTDSGGVYSFGRVERGQLGHGEDGPPSVPLRVQLPPEYQNGCRIRNIFAGGDSAFATCRTKEDDHKEPNGDTMTQQSIESVINAWTAECDSKSLKRIKQEIQELFSSASCLNRSFLLRRNDKHFETSRRRCGLDLSLAQQAFKKLLKMDVLAEVQAAVLQLLASLDPEPAGVEGLRLFLLLTELLHAVRAPELADAVAASIRRHSAESLHVIVDWWSALPPPTMIRHVKAWRGALSLVLLLRPTPRDSARNMLLILRQFYHANKKKKKIPETTFQFQLNEAFLQEELQLFRSPPGNEDVTRAPLVLGSHLFVMDLKSKKVVFDADCKRTQDEHQISAWNLQSGCQQQWDPRFCSLILRRTSLVEDAFSQLAVVDPSAFKLPLAVYFDEDPKLTDVYKRDFFHHVFCDIVQADSGMFMMDDSETLAWFRSATAVKDYKKYHLFGVLCGLALYNGSIIHLQFPLVLFKKLLNVEPTVEDMMEFCPVVGRSLQYILNYEDDDLETQDFYFSITWDGADVELDPENPGKPVTSQNKEEFVEAFVNYAFNASVRGPFEEFQRGFFQVCDRPLVQLFRPEELQGVLVGQGVYDWDKLKQNTVYECHPGHPSIRMFWEVFDELSEEKKKDFVWFLTGFRRVPILGMDQIQMKVRLKAIQGGSHDQHFPESLTCHSILQLPLYSAKEVMRDRLTGALNPERDFVMDP